MGFRELCRQKTNNFILIPPSKKELIRIAKSGLGHEAIAPAAAEVQRHMSQS
jgi:hypothetical protein